MPVLLSFVLVPLVSLIFYSPFAMIFFSIFKWSYLNFLLKYSWCINFWCTARWFSFILYIYIYLHIYMYYAKSCLTLLWPHGLYSPPGSSVHGISQARILKWVPLPPPGVLPDPGIEPVSPSWQENSLPLSHLGRPIVYSQIRNVLIVPCAV